MNTIAIACNNALNAGYTKIVTFAGELTIQEWRDMPHGFTAELAYENGRIITEWLPSLEKGQLERLVFLLA